MAEAGSELSPDRELSTLYDLTLGSAAGLQPEAHEPCSAWGQSPVLASEALLGDLRFLSVEGQFRTGL